MCVVRWLVVQGPDCYSPAKQQDQGTVRLTSAIPETKLRQSAAVGLGDGVALAIWLRRANTRGWYAAAADTFSAVQVPSASGPRWGVVRHDGRGGEALLLPTYPTEAEAQRVADRHAAQALTNGKAH